MAIGNWQIVFSFGMPTLDLDRGLCSSSWLYANLASCRFSCGHSVGRCKIQTMNREHVHHTLHRRLVVSLITHWLAARAFLVLPGSGRDAPLSAEIHLLWHQHICFLDWSIRNRGQSWLLQPHARHFILTTRASVWAAVDRPMHAPTRLVVAIIATALGERMHLFTKNTKMPSCGAWRIILCLWNAVSQSRTVIYIFLVLPILKTSVHGVPISR